MNERRYVRYQRVACVDAGEGAGGPPDPDTWESTCLVHSIAGALTNEQLNDVYFALLRFKDKVVAACPHST